MKNIIYTILVLNVLFCTGCTDQLEETIYGKFPEEEYWKTESELLTCFRLRAVGDSLGRSFFAGSFQNRGVCVGLCRGCRRMGRLYRLVVYISGSY